MNKAGAILIMLLMWGAVSATRASAQEIVNGNPANWCRNGLFPSEEAEFKLAKVSGAEGARTYFYGDEDNCPSADAKCKLKSYLITGDEVLISRRYGSWVCSWYQPLKGGETVGWLPVDSLTVSDAPDTSTGLEKWVGLWKYYEQTLNIRRTNSAGVLKVKGDALWRGLGDNVHIGSVDARARPQGNELILVEDDCRVVLKSVGAFLIVSDNSECGGANVRFNGVYRRGR